MWMAVIYLALGEKDQAFDWMQKAYDDRSAWLVYLKVDPLFDSVRTDPRFTDLLRGVGLTGRIEAPLPLFKGFAPGLFPALLQQLRDQASPAGLVAGADARAVVAVEVLVEEDVVPPVRIVLVCARCRRRRAGARSSSRRKMRVSRREISAATSHERQHLSRAGRALHLEVVAEVMMELLQRFDEQIVHREPDRTPPIGIAAEQTGAPIRPAHSPRGIRAVRAQDVRVFTVDPRDRANAVRREELLLIQHVAEHARICSGSTIASKRRSPFPGVFMQATLR